MKDWMGEPASLEMGATLALAMVGLVALILAVFRWVYIATPMLVVVLVLFKVGCLVRRWWKERV